MFLFILLLQIAALPVTLNPSDFAMVEGGAVPTLLKTIPEGKNVIAKLQPKLHPKLERSVTYRATNFKVHPNPKKWNMDGHVLNNAVKAANILTPALDLAGQLDPKGRAFLGLAKFLADIDPRTLQKFQKAAFALLAGTDLAGSVHDFQVGKLIQGGITNIENFKGHVQSLRNQYMRDLEHAEPIHQARQVLNTISPLIPLLPPKSPPRTISQVAVLAANLGGIFTPEKNAKLLKKRAI